MLFNSYFFVFLFLPIVLFIFFIIGRYSHSLASLWLASSSVFFYGWWDIRFVALLLISIVFNYGAGYLIGRGVDRQADRKAKLVLIASISTNLILLGYYKYANFLIDNLSLLTGSELSLIKVILPLGISFFTFTQIAFLVDTYQGKVKEYNFVHYLLFVTYFPHLIAGPVLHHKEMMPQFAKRSVCHINWDNIAAGFSIFILGMVKKVLIADSLSNFSSPIFNAVAAGGQPMFFEAWIGSLAYTLQLYFDFSAYSDMAIGISLMFNVHLPANFYSPYKATSIIEFWRCWHMTLSRFLRDYLYIPLGGSRFGQTRRYLNLFITMLLGGLWHGAGWTFLVWGALHGLYLMVNHGWRGIKVFMGWSNGGLMHELASGALTFVVVVVGWVFFRSETLSSAISMLHGMVGMNGLSLPISFNVVIVQYLSAGYLLNFDGWTPLSQINIFYALITIFCGLIIIWFMPNQQQIFKNYQTTLDHFKEGFQSKFLPQFFVNLVRGLDWRPKKYQAICYGLAFFLVLISMASVEKSEFLYFQF